MDWQTSKLKYLCQQHSTCARVTSTCHLSVCEYSLFNKALNTQTDGLMCEYLLFNMAMNIQMALHASTCYSTQQWTHTQRWPYVQAPAVQQGTECTDTWPYISSIISKHNLGLNSNGGILNLNYPKMNSVQCTETNFEAVLLDLCSSGILHSTDW
jgi:hypothetical protein